MEMDTDATQPDSAPLAIPAGAPSPRIVRTRTDDGADLALLRHAGTGPAVLLTHGIGTNAEIWDLQTVTTEAYTFKSLGTVLREAGFDVWMLHFRGRGSDEQRSHPPADLDDWHVDHHILYDVPAALRCIEQHRPGRPSVIGASMGAMVLAGYLQGARWDAERGRITADPEVAAARQAKLSGAVLISLPAALRWPKSLYDAGGTLNLVEALRDALRGEAGSNYPLEALADAAWLETLIVAVGGLPLDQLRPSGVGESVLQCLPTRVANAWRAGERRIVQFILDRYGSATGSTNLKAEVLLRGRRYVTDAINPGTLRQMAKSVRARSFVSFLGTVDHDYAAHYDQIALPMMLAIGDRDRIADPSVTRAAFFERISSRDKTWLEVPNAGHGDLEITPLATRAVYPQVCAFVARVASD